MPLTIRPNMTPQKMQNPCQPDYMYIHMEYYVESSSIRGEESLVIVGSNYLLSVNNHTLLLHTSWNWQQGFTV